MGVLANLRRLLPAPLRTRSLDAAGGGRRWVGARTFGWVNAEVAAGAVPLRQRAAFFVRNNAWAASGVRALVGNIVGTGIVPTSKHPDPAVREAIQRRWQAWTDECDADGRSDFYGLEALACRAMVEG